MPNAQDKDCNYLILNITDDPVIAKTVTPKIAQVTLQRLSRPARVIRFSYSFAEKFYNSSLNTPV
jgi:hypothetical protein